MTATILVVEEHEILRWSLHTWLEFTFPECRIIEAVDDEQATSLVFTHQPEVIILDTHPVDGGAFGQVRRLRAVAPASAIAVLTDYNDDAHREHAFASGADACVFKRAILVQLELVLSKFLLAAGQPMPPRQEVPRANSDGKTGGQLSR